MTDARLPDRWLTDRRLLRLPDDAFRLFVTSLMWSVSNKTDGVLDDSDLPLLPHVDPGRGAQLAEAGLWQRDADRWMITDFADTQSSKSELDALALRRRSDRKRKAAQRQREAKSREASRDSHAERVRLGQARQGTKTEGPVWLPTEAEIASLGAAQQRRAAGGNSDGTSGQSPTPPQTRKRVPDGTNLHGPDVHQIPIEVQLQSPTADRNAREDRQPCPVCGMKQQLRSNGKITRHGPSASPCRGSGVLLTGTAS